MELPVTNPADPGYGQQHQHQQPWPDYRSWAPVLPPTGSSPGMSSSFPPSYQPFHSTTAPQSRPADMGPMWQLPSVPGGTVGSGLTQQAPCWFPSPPHCNGVLKPVPDVSSPTQMAPQGINSQPTSPVSSPKSESRYGMDPQLLPSVVQVLHEDRAQWEGKVFTSESQSTVPPLSTTACTLEDRGNATARFVRCTSYSFPVEAQSAQQSHLPLAAIFCPLAKPENQERAVPVCEVGECVKGCVECGAFMSPAMSWQDCGQRFFCPFCGKLTEVPWQSYQPTNKGKRIDQEKRPELSLGSYEILEAQKVLNMISAL